MIRSVQPLYGGAVPGEIKSFKRCLVFVEHLLSCLFIYMVNFNIIVISRQTGDHCKTSGSASSYFVEHIHQTQHQVEQISDRSAVCWGDIWRERRWWRRNICFCKSYMQQIASSCTFILFSCLKHWHDDMWPHIYITAVDFISNVENSFVTFLLEQDY